MSVVHTSRLRIEKHEGPHRTAHIELLQGASVQNRKLAAWTLGNIGQGAVEAIQVLLVAVQDTNEGVRKMAREALDKISPFGTQARAA
jgi:hypothetical protein